RLPARKVEGVDDRHPKATRRHRMALRRLVLMEGDLHARHAGPGRELLDQCRWGMAIAPARGTKENDAVTVAAVGIGIGPSLVAIEAHEGLDPAGAIKVGPLTGEPQMRLDDHAADGFEVEDAGEAFEVPGDPGAAGPLQRRLVGSVNGPAVEHA